MRKSWLLLFFVVTSLGAGVPVRAVQSFAWPDPVAEKMSQVTALPGQKIKLAGAEKMISGYCQDQDRFLTYPVITAGTEVEAWRVDYSGEKYFLIRSGSSWYWKCSGPTTSVEPVGSSSLSTRHRLTWSADYWRGGYSQISAFKSGIFWQTAWAYNSRKAWQSVKWSGQGGLVVRYKPVGSLFRQLPMLKARVDCNWQPVPAWRLEWYSAASYFYSLEHTRSDDFWEVYNKLSHRKIFGLKKWDLNLTYFGSLASQSDWEYGEGKIQLVYNFPKFWLGSEISSANWLNDTGWRTQTRSRFPGSFVVGHWGDDYQWQFTIGRYFQESGQSGIIRRQVEEINANLLLGVTIKNFGIGGRS